jgi:CRISPR/Cas system endoribonuclease Cas6 (RAMP superfamily)
LDLNGKPRNSKAIAFWFSSLFCQEKENEKTEIFKHSVFFFFFSGSENKIFEGCYKLLTSTKKLGFEKNKVDEPVAFMDNWI